jgi:hypothetical protein
MRTLAYILSITSGFFLFGFRGSDLDLVMTALVISLVLAGLTASIAAKRGRSRHAWFLIGLGGGLWAFAAVLILLPSANRPLTKGTGSKPPTAPHAA